MRHKILENLLILYYKKMKIDIKTMLLTFGVFLLFAFTAGDILTIKPATPKEVYNVKFKKIKNGQK